MIIPSEFAFQKLDKVELTGADDVGYQVSSVLSVYWWDDGSWDFNKAQ
jgi:hypothetical protein